MVLRQTATLTQDELAASLGRAKARNLPLWDFLVLERQIPEDVLANAFSKALNLPRVSIDAMPVEAAALEAVAGWLAHKHTCLPIRFAGKALVLAMANPLDSMAIHDVQFASSRHVTPVVASRTDILTGIRRCYASTARAKVEAEPPPEPEEACVFTVESAPAEQTRASDASTAVELCSQIMSDAITLGASDIHIEAGASETRVRLRIDGVLREHLQLPDWMRGALLSRIKILAKLDIAEQRVPQDGRIQLRGPESADRCARLDVADAVRREGGPPAPRIGRHADAGRARLLGRRSDAPRRSAPPAAGTDPRDRPDRGREEHDALLHAGAPPVQGDQHRHDRGPDRVSSGGRHPGAGEREGRV